jgi:hypothetical protein
MAFVDDLSTELQTALKKAIPDRMSTEIILDPSGLNIDLSDFITGNAALSIRKSKNIQLAFGALGRYTLPETHIEMKNIGDKFNVTQKGKTFYYAVSRLYAAKASGDAYVDLINGEGDKFDDPTITKVYLRIGSTVTEFTISSIDTSPADYDRINFTASGSIAYAAGSIIETEFLPGKDVTVKTVIDGQAEKIDQFKGVLSGHPNLAFGRTRITLYNTLKQLLDVDVKATSFKILTDADRSTLKTIEYTRAEDPASDGLLDLDGVAIVTSRCKIGTWEIEFTDGSGTYKVTDTEGNVVTGFTTADTLAHIPSGSAPQIQIGSEDWSGTFDEGDKIKFQTVCALGAPVTSAVNVPAFIRLLLLQDYGADLTSADLNDSNFTDLIDEYVGLNGAITFTEPTKVLKAIEILQLHIMGTLFPRNDGKIDIAVYRPRYEDPALHSLSPDADIREIDMEDLGRIDRIVGLYDYDYQDKEFKGQIVYPDDSAPTTNSVELKFPAFFGDGITRGVLSRLYSQWQKGVRAYQINEKWNYGLAFEINDLVKISSNHPKFGSRPVEVFELTKNLNTYDVGLKAYDHNLAFQHYAFVDIHKTNRGKVVW